MLSHTFCYLLPNALSHLTHEQKLHDIHVTEKNRYCSSTVSNIIAYEKILARNLQELDRPLFDVNALNLFFCQLAD